MTQKMHLAKIVLTKNLVKNTNNGGKELKVIKLKAIQYKFTEI